MNEQQTETIEKAKMEEVFPRGAIIAFILPNGGLDVTLHHREIKSKRTIITMNDHPDVINLDKMSEAMINYWEGRDMEEDEEWAGS